MRNMLSIVCFPFSFFPFLYLTTSVLQVLSDGQDSSLKHKLFNISPAKSRNVVLSPKLMGRTLTKDRKSSSEDIIPGNLIRLPLSFKSWSYQNTLWDSLPRTIHDLGKV